MRVLMTTAHAKLMDGVNRHIQMLAPVLNRMDDVEVLVVVCTQRGALNDVLENAGVQTFSLGLSSIRSLVGVVRLWRVILRFQPDVVHIEMPVILVNMAVMLAKIVGVSVRVVATIHGVGGSNRRGCKSSRTIRGWFSYGKIRLKLHACVNQRLDGMIYISRGVLNAHPRLPIYETEIYNPVQFLKNECGCSETVQKVLGLPENIPVIGTACRIAEVKRPDCFVRVMLKVLEALPEAHAVVLGDGDPVQMNRMRELVQASGLESRFHLFGYRSDAKQLIASFSCFVMTSYREGMPTALLEAMSQKVPVAFWKGEGGLVDLAELNAKEGPIAIVREQDDEAGLASEIVAALKSTETLRENANRAFEVCRKIFDVESIARQTVAFYRKICAK